MCAIPQAQFRARRAPATFGSYTFSDGDANNIPGGGTVNITPGFQYQIGINDANERF